MQFLNNVKTWNSVLWRMNENHRTDIYIKFISLVFALWKATFNYFLLNGKGSGFVEVRKNQNACIICEQILIFRVIYCKKQKLYELCLYIVWHVYLPLRFLKIEEIFLSSFWNINIFLSRHVVDDGINDGDSGCSGWDSKNAVWGSADEVCVSRGMWYGHTKLFGRLFCCTPGTSTHLLSRNMPAFVNCAHIYWRRKGAYEGKELLLIF